MTDTTQSVPTPVPTINPQAATAVADVTSLIGDGVTAAETAIIAAAPAMATPVWKQIWEAAMSGLVNWVITPFVTTFTGKIVISLDSYLALTNAVASQAALNAAKQGGNADAIAQASSANDQAVATAINYIGASK